MRRVAPHLRLATSALVSNVWLLEDGERRFLVDTGYTLERPTLAFSLARAGLRGPGDVTAVLLTHRHSDHAGNAAWLRERFACPLICHAADAPFLRGHTVPPPLARGVGTAYEEFFCRIEDRFPARSVVDEVFEHGPWKWGFQAIHVPGHTEGSAMLYHEPTRTLFSGDAILAGLPPQRLLERLNLAVPGFSLDVERCRESVKRFLRVLPRTDSLCSGHGPAVTRDTEAKLRRLLRRMDSSSTPAPAPGALVPSSAPQS